VVFPAKAKFQNGTYQGDILHSNSENLDAEITISGAQYTGRITTATSSHPHGMPRSKEQYSLIGRVEHYPCPKDTAYKLKVTLEDGATWTVTEVSYLNELTISADSAVAGTLTVNGEETPLVPGTYTGKLVLKP
jgi:uncharacterized protein YwbE